MVWITIKGTLRRSDQANMSLSVSEWLHSQSAENRLKLRSSHEIKRNQNFPMKETIHATSFRFNQVTLP